MKTSKYPPEESRGFLHAAIPDLVPLVQSAMECRNIPPREVKEMTSTVMWMLIYVFSPARITVLCRGQTPCLCPAHSAILLPPGIRYTVDTRPARGLSRHLWMAMDGLQLTPLLAMMMCERHENRLLFHDPEGLLAEHMENLVDAGEKAQPRAFWCAHMLGRRVVELLQTAEKRSPLAYCITRAQGVPPVDRIVTRVVDYLQRHLGERISLHDLSRQVGVSPSTLSHRYRMAAGETPMQTLNRLRLLQTKIRLMRGDTVENIAHDLGFYDAKHLTLTFRKAEGIPPSVFVRKNARAVRG